MAQARLVNLPVSRQRAERARRERVHFRLSRGEAKALAELVRRHGEKLDELGASGDSANAWFVATVKRLAKEAGVEIVEPDEERAESPAQRKTAAKPTRKRASTGAG